MQIVKSFEACMIFFFEKKQKDELWRVDKC